MTEKILQVSEMSSGELQKQFAIIHKQLMELSAKVNPTNETILLTPKQVLEWLGISAPTLHDWVNKGILTRYKLGNRAFYKKEEIIASLDGSKYSDKL